MSIHNHSNNRLTSLISPLLELGLLDDVLAETLDVLSSLGLCLTTSLLRTSWLPLLISDEDLTVSRDASPPDCALYLEGEWLTNGGVMSVWWKLVTPDEPASVVLRNAIEGEECWRTWRDGVGDALGLPCGLCPGLALGLALGLTLGLDVGVALLPTADGCWCVCVHMHKI